MSVFTYFLLQVVGGLDIHKKMVVDVWVFERPPSLPPTTRAFLSISDDLLKT